MTTTVIDSLESDRLSRTLTLLDELRTAISIRQSQVVELRAEATELRSEVDRHHRDFRYIQDALDEYDTALARGAYSPDYLGRALARRIRAIVA